VSEAQDFATHIVDLLESFGPCEARRMFGGYGIFHQGLMFGLIADGNLYLKADAKSRDRFRAEGCSAFSYYKKDKEYQLSYFLAPDEFFEEEAACLDWARLAFDAALRNPARKKKNRKS
jgi:DNA transformation protein